MFQVNFQVVIATDGSISIAMFIYDRDLNHLLGLFSDIPIMSGFDSGDGIRGDNSIRDSNFNIIPEFIRSEKVYGYRIDGKRVSGTVSTVHLFRPLNYNIGVLKV